MFLRGNIFRIYPSPGAVGRPTAADAMSCGNLYQTDSPLSEFRNQESEDMNFITKRTATDQTQWQFFMLEHSVLICA